MEVHVSTNRLVILANALLNFMASTAKPTLTTASMTDPNATTAFALILPATAPIPLTLNVSVTLVGNKMAMAFAHGISTNV